MGKLNHVLKAIKKRKAFHGSPHDFDEFKTSKIGTGEGNQAYGHGLYFSSSEDIGRFYRDTVGPAGGWTGRPKAFDGLDLSSIPEERLGRLEARYQAQGPEAARHLVDEYLRNPGSSAERDALIDLSQGDWSPSGKLYEVEIPDESHMLDWDAPLSEQPESVRGALEQAGLYKDNSARIASLKAEQDALGVPTGSVRDRWIELDDEIRGIGLNNVTGEDFYRRLSATPGFVGDGRRTANIGGGRASDSIVSEKLRELGIPGITYKGATSNERNFVVFDDQMVNILQKGAATPQMLAATAAAGGGAAYALSQDPDVQQSRAAIEEFQRKRDGKSWSAGAKAAAAMGSGIAGGYAGTLSKLGGYLNPFIDVDESEQAAEQLTQSMTYQPEGQNAYLDSMGQELQTLDQDIQRGLPSEDDWNESLPGRAYNALPRRVQGIIKTVPELF